MAEALINLSTLNCLITESSVQRQKIWYFCYVASMNMLCVTTLRRCTRLAQCWLYLQHWSRLPVTQH